MTGRSLSAAGHLTRTTSGCSANPQRPADTHAAVVVVAESATRRARSARTPGPHTPTATARPGPVQTRWWQQPSTRPSCALSARHRRTAVHSRSRSRVRASGWPAARRRGHTIATRARRASCGGGMPRTTRTSRASRQQLRARRARTASRSAGRAGCTARAAGGRGRGRRHRVGRTQETRWTRWDGGGCRCNGGHGHGRRT